MGQERRPEHQHQQRNNGHYALGMSLSEAGETNNRRGGFISLSPS